MAVVYQRPARQASGGLPQSAHVERGAIPLRVDLDDLLGELQLRRHVELRDRLVAARCACLERPRDHGERIAAALDDEPAPSKRELSDLALAERGVVAAELAGLRIEDDRAGDSIGLDLERDRPLRVDLVARTQRRCATAGSGFGQAGMSIQ